MVELQRMAVVVISRTRRFLNDGPPSWAVNLEQKIDTLTRKVNTLMTFDTQVVARLVAAAGSLADQSKRVAAERDAYKAAAEQNGADLAAVREELAQATAAEAAEDQAEAAATDQINAAADAILGMVNSPETPDVTPVPIEDVPAVVDGSQPVVDGSGNEVPADEPVTGENPAAEAPVDAAPVDAAPAEATDAPDVAAPDAVSTDATQDPNNPNNV